MSTALGTAGYNTLAQLYREAANSSAHFPSTFLSCAFLSRVRLSDDKSSLCAVISFSQGWRVSLSSMISLAFPALSPPFFKFPGLLVPLSRLSRARGLTTLELERPHYPPFKRLRFPLGTRTRLRSQTRGLAKPTISSSYTDTLVKYTTLQSPFVFYEQLSSNRCSALAAGSKQGNVYEQRVLPVPEFRFASAMNKSARSCESYQP